MTTFKSSRRITLMCGDGANNIRTLKQTLKEIKLLANDDDDDVADDNIEEKVFPPLPYSYASGYRYMKRNSYYKCMTRSSTKELFMPFKDPEREFRSSRKLFKTLSLDESRSPEFNLFSDLEEYSKDEVAETMTEPMEQYMSKTRADYGSGIARPKIDDKDHFELKGQFLKELRDNTFSGSDHEEANEHIKKVLEIVDLFHIHNITQHQVMLRAFHMSLTESASRWLRNKTFGSITT
ncbi:hypothetical protein Tco_0618549 [Tanacetum coccineum]